MSRRFAERISNTYSRHSEKSVSVLEPARAHMAEEIAQLAGLSSGQLALDLATGTALIAPALARFGASIVGVDFSLGVLKIADSHSSCILRIRLQE